MRKSGRLLIVTLCLLATLASRALAKPERILVVLSGQDKITLANGVEHPTGFYMNELLVPLKALVDAGFQPVFATPGGHRPSPDARSDSADSFGGDEAKYKQMKAFMAGLDGLKKPRVLADVAREGIAGYRAVFVPGGHAPMQDLWRDPSMGKILAQAHAAKKPTALICHGPIALLSALADPNALVAHIGKSPSSAAWPYRGYKMTIFTTAEEQVAEQAFLGGKVRFYPDAALRAAGGNVVEVAPFLSNVVVDRELITGQNPASDDAFAKALLKALGK